MADDDARAELETLLETMNYLRFHGIRPDAADEHAAKEAVANTWSGYGPDIPYDQAIAMCNALETGYLLALNDVRDRNVDGLGPVED